MSVKYHINSKGLPAICRAQKGKCPFGGSESHYPTLEEAQSAADEKNKEKFGIFNNVPGLKKSLFRVAETEGDKAYVKHRIEKLTEESKKARAKTGRLQDGNYMEKCRKSKLIETIRSGEMTDHLEVDRADRISRISELFGEGEVVASFEVDHFIKRINGFRFTVQSLTVRDNGRISMYDRKNKKEITTFQASGPRIEAIFLRAGLIPDRDMLDLATKNHSEDKAVEEGRSPRDAEARALANKKKAESAKKAAESVKKAVESAKKAAANSKRKSSGDNYRGENKNRGRNNRQNRNRGRRSSRDTRNIKSERVRDKSWKLDYEDYDY